MAETLFNAYAKPLMKTRDSAVFVLGEDVVTTVALIKLPKTYTKIWGNEGFRHPCRK